MFFPFWMVCSCQTWTTHLIWFLLRSMALQLNRPPRHCAGETSSIWWNKHKIGDYLLLHRRMYVFLTHLLFGMQYNPQYCAKMLKYSINSRNAINSHYCAKICQHLINSQIFNKIHIMVLKFSSIQLVLKDSINSHYCAKMPNTRRKVAFRHESTSSVW